MGVPFTAESTSECNPTFRQLAQANYIVNHVHETLSDQVEEQPCLLHYANAETCKLPECDLGVMGTPCQPYSHQRVKRNHKGSVKEHPLYKVTFTDGLGMVEKNHKALVLEQVIGFDDPEDADDQASPMKRHKV
jgi:site-specific DNA-cytosine methylase